MPKGDNLRGLFHEVTVPASKGVIAFVNCPVCSGEGANKPIPLKITKQGHLFANCSRSGGCGRKSSYETKSSARYIAGKAYDWCNGSKSIVLGVISGEPMSAPAPELSPTPEPAPALEPEHTPKKQMRGLRRFAK